MDCCPNFFGGKVARQTMQVYAAAATSPTDGQEIVPIIPPRSRQTSPVPPVAIPGLPWGSPIMSIRGGNQGSKAFRTKVTPYCWENSRATPHDGIEFQLSSSRQARHFAGCGVKTVVPTGRTSWRNKSMRPARAFNRRRPNQREWILVDDSAPRFSGLGVRAYSRPTAGRISSLASYPVGCRPARERR